MPAPGSRSSPGVPRAVGCPRPWKRLTRNPPVDCPAGGQMFLLPRQTEVPHRHNRRPETISRHLGLPARCQLLRPIRTRGEESNPARFQRVPRLKTDRETRADPSLPVKRRGGDSNPRNGYPFTRFPVAFLQPLGHLSWLGCEFRSHNRPGKRAPTDERRARAADNARYRDGTRGS